MTTPDFLAEDMLEGDATTGSPSPFSGRSTERTDAETNPFAGLGPLLEEADPRKVVEAVIREVQAQAPSRKRRRTEWECAKLWVKGVRGVRTRRLSEDRNNIELVIPLGAFDVPPVMDRTEELLEKYVAHLLSDPAVPEAEPAGDTDEDRDAAEFTTRLLLVEGAESGYNNAGVVRRAAKKAAMFQSGFVYPCIDPMGGGWRPMQIRAHPQAPTADRALFDPVTGAPITDESALESRYVMEDGTLSAKSKGARRQWLPKIRPEVLTGEHVVLLPETCSGVNDATGMVLIRHTTLGKLRASFPAIAKLSQDRLRELVDWRPDDAKRTMPGFVKQSNPTPINGDSQNVPDSALICTLSLYYTSHGEYPKGAYIVVAGDDLVLHRQPWSGVVEVAPGEVEEECMELPLAQFRLFNDDVDDDHMGRDLVRQIGPADDVRGQIVLAWLEYLDRFLSPNTFLPMGSIIQPDEVEARDGRVLYYNPQGKPETEQIPQFPGDAKEFFDRATRSQDSAIMLEQTAQGAEVSSVTSGAQVEAIAGLAHQNLATSKALIADGQERLWRIITQQIRVHYTIPTMLGYESDDGAYKEREWSRVDLGSTRNIKIAKGSFTQQTPAQKQQQLDVRFKMQLIDGDEYARLSASNIRAAVGFQDNPHRLRVRSQIATWRDGPDDNAETIRAEYQQALAAWQQQTALIQQQVQAATVLAQQTGQPAPAAPPMPPQPIDPLDPFKDVRPVDREQLVAILRHKELSRAMASGTYTRHEPWWRQYLDRAYAQAKQDAGVTTLAEQQQAQQQQAQAQSQQQQAAATAQSDAQAKADAAKLAAHRDELATKAAMDAERRSAESTEKDRDRVHEREMAALDAQQRLPAA